MKKISMLVMICMLVLTMSSTALAFGLGGLGNLLGGKGGAAVDIDGLGSTAQRIIIKYNLSTIAFAKALADSMKAVGLQERSAQILAEAEALSSDQSREKGETLGKTMGEGVKEFNEAVRNANLSQEDAQALIDSASAKASAAGLINLSMIPDGIKLLKDTNDGLSALTRDPISNAGKISKLKSTIEVVQYLNKAMPYQEQLHKDYNATMKYISEQHKLTMPSQEQIQQSQKEILPQ